MLNILTQAVPTSARRPPVDVAVWIVCALGAAFGAWALHVGWLHSILDLHQWRQSHTALSAVEMVRGGPFWRYLTPILGPPWSSPIEFPLYQWMVAGVARSLSMNVETSGRAVSVTFFAATLVAYWFALDLIAIDRRHRPIFVALALASPLYLFWSRAFMIESTALCFAVCYLLAVHRATAGDRTPRETATWLAAAVAAGVIGAMVKVTTFVPWWTGAALLVAIRARRGRRSRAARIGVAAALIVPALAAAGWLAFTDVVNAGNPLAARLAWSTVAWQHVGPFRMRFSLRSWYEVPGSTILGSTRHTVIGSLAVFSAACLAIAILRRRVVPSLLCLALYMLPIAVFMNLYVEHVYYGYANGLFLITIVGCGIVALLERRGAVSWLGLALLASALVAMSTNYLRGYYVDQQSDNASRWPLARTVGAAVPANEVLLIFGLDLNPEFTYTAGRRAVMDWENRGAGNPALERALGLLAHEGRRVGALVACGDSRSIDAIGRTVSRLDFGGAPSYRDTFCDVFVPRNQKR